MLRRIHKCFHEEGANWYKMLYRNHYLPPRKSLGHAIGFIIDSPKVPLRRLVLGAVLLRCLCHHSVRVQFAVLMRWPCVLTMPSQSGVWRSVVVVQFAVLMCCLCLHRVWRVVRGWCVAYALTDSALCAMLLRCLCPHDVIVRCLMPGA